MPFGEAQNKFKTAAEAGSGAPDILRAEVAWVPEFASLGYLYALDGTAAARGQADFLETPLSSSNVYDGKTYGVPQVTDTLGLIYNKKLFDEGRHRPPPPPPGPRSRPPPPTLKAKAGVDGLYINAGGYFLLPFIYGEGGDLVDTDGQEDRRQLATRTSPASRSPRTWSRAAPRSSRRQRLLRHDDDPVQGAARSP